jgi:hypothetical protein
MSHRRRRFPALPGALVLLGCAAADAPGPVPGYPFAYASNECGPADGPATTLYLSERALDSLPPAGGHLAVTVWVGRDEALGRTFRSSDQPAQGFAAECGSAVSCEPAAAWRVTLRGISRDTLAGSVDLLLGSRRVAGSFRARWMPMRQYCG